MRDAAVKGHVFLDAVAAGGHGLGDRGQRRVDGGHVALAPRRGLRGDLCFQRAAQFHDMQHGIQRAQLGGVDARARLPVAPVTNTPLPWRASTMPSWRSRDTASRITVRLTPNCSASAVSVGSLSPGCARPSWISASRRLATVSVRVGGEESLGNDMGRGGRVGGSAPSVWQAGRPGYAQ